MPYAVFYNIVGPKSGICFIAQTTAAGGAFKLRVLSFDVLNDNSTSQLHCSFPHK